jgi:TetR/AcrR family transcriptional regulator, lmrAB and yxaGH operons repressor
MELLNGGRSTMKETKERRSREDVVVQLREVFRRFGYEGATLSRISDVTGLGRASLYHHFPNGKDEMIKAVLEKTEEMFDREILGRLRADLPPEERMRNVLDHFWTHYSGGSTTCFLALLALTANEGELGAGIQRLFRKWVTGFADVIREAGVRSDVADLRAEDAVMRIQGALILASAMNDPSPFQRVMLMLSDSMLAADGSENDARRRRAAPNASRRAARGVT